MYEYETWALGVCDSMVKTVQEHSAKENTWSYEGGCKWRKLHNKDFLICILNAISSELKDQGEYVKWIRCMKHFNQKTWKQKEWHRWKDNIKISLIRTDVTVWTGFNWLGVEYSYVFL